MKQSRVSAMEQPGAVNFNIETLVRSAATYGVGLVVRFVPFSEMLRWENSFDQDAFDVVPIGEDTEFITGTPAPQVMGSLNSWFSNFGTLSSAYTYTFPAQKPVETMDDNNARSSDAGERSQLYLTNELIRQASQDENVLPLAENAAGQIVLGDFTHI